MKITKDSIYSFIKFIHPDFEEVFLNGKLHMRELQYFINLEKTNGKGKGDRNEGSLVYNNVNLIIDGYEIKNDEIEHLSINSPKIVQMPVFCLYAIQMELFEEIESTKEHVKLTLKIPNEELVYMEKEFGSNLFLINARELINRVEIACKKNNINLAKDLVKYYDYSVDELERINASKDIFNNKIAFMKDISFKAQHEYRFLLSDVEMENDELGNYYELEIGDIRDITKKISISDLTKLDLLLTL